MPVLVPSITLDKFTTFGDLLKYLRRRTGLTQRELSIAVGYSDTQISRLELNQRPPDLATIAALFVPALGLEHEAGMATRLMELAVAVNREDAPDPGLPPFKGLHYFDEADAHLFFGREALVATLVTRILGGETGEQASAAEHPSVGQHSNPQERFLAVVGASGSGKSSIVRAGLIPALRWNRSSTDWPVHILTPTAHPLEALAASLTREAQSPAMTATFIDDLARDPRSLHLYARRLLSEDGSGPSESSPHYLSKAPRATSGLRTGNDRLLLIVDQFEELFTLCRDEAERKALVDNLMMAVEMDGPISVILTLRADFYAHCAPYDGLREALAKHQEYIGPMNAEQLRQVVEKPAKRGGWEIEPSLVDLLLRDVGDEPGALPLLSHALFETWQRRQGRKLTLSGYTSSGGVRGAIAETAETVFRDQLLPEQRAIARRIFLRLTELGEDSIVGDTRRRAAFDELISRPEEAVAVQAVLKTLADARLITTEANAAEVAHEALIREWPTLRAWLEDDREALRLHRRLSEAAHSWEESGQPAGDLYRDARLAQALEWATTHDGDMNALERTFLAASQAHGEHETIEREAQRQRELDGARQVAVSAQRLAETEKQRAEEQGRAAAQLRRRALYLSGFAILALALAVLAVFFGERARQSAVSAQNQERLAFSRELAAAAVSNLEIDPERSILLALQAVSVTQLAGLPVPLEVEDALHRAVQASRIQLTLYAHEPGGPINVAFSPDASSARLATAGADEVVKVWDADTGQVVFTLAGHFVAFSPDGQRLATITIDRTVKMWDAATGQALPLAGNITAGFGLAFSPDGSRLVTAIGRLAKIWDVATGQELVTFSGHTDSIGSVSFSSDGTRLITASNDGTVRVWNATTGEALLTLPTAGHLGPIFSAAFSSDGKRVAAAISGSAPKVWDATTGDELLTLVGHTNIVYNIVFSPAERGARLVTGSLDRTVRVWDAATGQELFTLSGHTGAISGLAFSPDGTRLATGSLDGTVRVWDLTSGREWLTLATLEAYSGRVAFSPDGTRLASGGCSACSTSAEIGAVNVWDTTTGQLLLTLSGHHRFVENVAFSPDGTRLASASEDRTAKIWSLASSSAGDAQSGAELFTLSGHSAGLGAVVFSPDGLRLATASDDQKVMVWDATTGQLLVTLDHPTGVPCVAFSPDGARLATGDYNGTVRVWDVVTGQELLTLRGHTDTVWGVTFSPDGARLASASRDGTAKVWEAATGQELITLLGHTGTVVTIVFSPDGTRLATASRDGTAKVWEAATGKELLSFFGDGSGLNGVAFSPDGSRLAVGSDKGVLVYLLGIEDLAALAQTRVTRSLASDECQKYLHLDQTACAPVAPIPTAPILPPTAKSRVCQVAEPGGLHDIFYSELIYKGTQDVAEKFGWEATALESDDLQKTIQKFIDADCDLIVGWSFGLADVTRVAAEANPTQKFQIMDVVEGPPLAQVWAQTYATDQAAFLAGYVAASVTKTGKVGTFGGIGISPITDFMDGFALGVAYYNKKNGTSVEVLGWDVQTHEGLFVGGFCCSAEGRQMAVRLLNDGADIILSVAGPSVDAGAAAEVQEHPGVYFIGVDADWAINSPDYANIVLTSIERHLDLSVVLAVQAVAEGTFTGGAHIGTLETGEVGLSPFYDLDGLVSPQIKADLEQIKADIIAGNIKTKP